jgi:cell division protein FtsI/penicillin-binding protein 2
MAQKRTDDEGWHAPFVPHRQGLPLPSRLVSRRSWIALAVVVVLVAAGLPAGFLVLKHRRDAADRAAQRNAAASFARAWQGGSLGSLTYAGASGQDVAATVQKLTGSLTVATKDAPSSVEVGSVGSATGSPATVKVALDVTWKLAGGRTWSYPTAVDLVKSGGAWRPRFTPSVVHPKLTEGAVLRATTKAPRRGRIIGADDKVLVTERPVVEVGLEPDLADNITINAQQIADIVDVDGAALAKRAKAAKPNAFVLAISLREAAFQDVRGRLRSVSGAVFQEREVSLAPSARFARALIGSVGEATAEIVKGSEGRVRAGDTTGLSGLQRTYDEQLAGTPGFVVEAVRSPGAGEVATDIEPLTLLRENPVNGKDVHITLDERIQDAADEALTKAKKPAGLVAVRVSTGEVLAVANGGPNATGYNRALLGQYPPGSTYKVASGLALLKTGLNAETRVPCPATFNVNGKVFTNSEDGALGNVPFRTDFADSCNNAFVGQATKVSPAELAEAAASLGYGEKNQLGVAAFTGSVPDQKDPVLHAAAMIGQGKVLASPLAVAGASAAVGSGTWHAPRLVIDPKQPAAEGRALPAGPARELKKLMREVVTSGTGTGIRSVPGGPVSGKTGTAQYGNDDPPAEHSWFTGFQGDIAFACVVEGGGFGATSALPLVKDFLTTLAD